MKMLTCEMFELGRIFNEGIYIRFEEKDSPIFFYNFGGLNFKQINVCINDSNEVYFFVYDRPIYLKDHLKTWWYEYESEEVEK